MRNKVIPRPSSGNSFGSGVDNGKFWKENLQKNFGVIQIKQFCGYLISHCLSVMYFSLSVIEFVREI